MKYIQLVIPAIICVFIIYLTSMSIEYYPLSFGVIIGLFNWKRHKYNPFLGVILSILVSYIAFFIAYFGGDIIDPIMNFIFDSINYSKSSEKRGVIILTIMVSIIAPLLVFSFYKFVFEISKTKINIIVILITVILLVFAQYFTYNFYENISKNFNIYMLWQFIMALALQLILYQESFKIKKG